MTSTQAPIKVLFAEDDEGLARLTARYLQGSGLLVSCAATGPDALIEARRRQYDVVLLDIMLPGKDGVDVCRELRASMDVPIIMLTARTDESDRVMGLDAGADDYVTKPFSSRELVSRIRAVVRRARGLAGPRLQRIEVGEIALDVASRSVWVSGESVSLTGYEFALLQTLAERAGRVLSREQLLDLAKGSAEEAYDRSIDVQISRLRQKLGDDARQPRFLKTVRGAGYLLARGDERCD